MPSKYLTTALRALWPIYRVPQPNTPPSLDLDLPIQVVHDVSGDARIARGLQAFAVLSTLCGIDPDDTYTSMTRAELLNAQVLRTLLASRQMHPEDVDVWVLDAMAGVTAATADKFLVTGNNIRAAINHGFTGTPAFGESFGFWDADDVKSAQVTATSAVQLFGPAAGTVRPAPSYLEDDEDSALLFGATNVGGAGDDFQAFVTFRLWLAPRGARPLFG